MMKIIPKTNVPNRSTQATNRGPVNAKKTEVTPRTSNREPEAVTPPPHSLRTIPPTLWATAKAWGTKKAALTYAESLTGITNPTLAELSAHLSVDEQEAMRRLLGRVFLNNRLHLSEIDEALESIQGLKITDSNLKTNANDIKYRYFRINFDYQDISFSIEGNNVQTKVSVLNRLTNNTDIIYQSDDLDISKIEDALKDFIGRYKNQFDAYLTVDGVRFYIPEAKGYEEFNLNGQKINNGDTVLHVQPDGNIARLYAYECRKNYAFIGNDPPPNYQLYLVPKDEHPDFMEKDKNNPHSVAKISANWIQVDRTQNPPLRLRISSSEEKSDDLMIFGIRFYLLEGNEDEGFLINGRRINSGDRILYADLQRKLLRLTANISPFGNNRVLLLSPQESGDQNFIRIVMGKIEPMRLAFEE